MEKDKWTEIIGCSSEFNSKGELIIYRNAKTYSMSGMNGDIRQQFMVVGSKRGYLLITPNGNFVSQVKKRFCKIK